MEALCDEEDFDPIVVSSSSSQPCDSDLPDPADIIEENDGPFPTCNPTRRSALRHVYDSDREFKHVTGEHPWKFPAEARVCNCWQTVGGKATSDPYLLGSMKHCGCIIGSLNAHLCPRMWAL